MLDSLVVCNPLSMHLETGKSTTWKSTYTNVYLVSKMEKIDYMLVKLLCLVLLSIWNCNGNITTCNESVESKVCFLVNKVKNLGFSPLSDSQIVGLESN